MYLSGEEERELNRECGDAASHLFRYYLSKGGTPDFHYTDQKAATATGWSLRKVQEVRRKLIKHHWFYRTTGTFRDGRKITAVYLGKEDVKQGMAKKVNLIHMPEDNKNMGKGVNYE